MVPVVAPRCRAARPAPRLAHTVAVVAGLSALCACAVPPVAPPSPATDAFAAPVAVAAGSGGAQLLLRVPGGSPGRPACEQKPGVDAWCDPLPPGVLARLGTERFPEAALARVAAAPDGRFYASADHDHVVVWDAASGLPLRAIPVGGSAGLAFAGDATRLVAAESDELSVVETATGKILVHYERRDERWAGGPGGALDAVSWITDLAVSGAHIALGSCARRGDEPVVVLDLDGRQVARLALGEPREDTSLDVTCADAVALAGGGALLAAGRSGLALWQERDWRAAGEPTHRLPLDFGSLQGLAFSPDGRWLAVAGSGEAVNALALAERRVGRSYGLLRGGGSGSAFAPVYSPDGARFAVAYRDAVRLFAADTGREERRIADIVSRSAVFAPDGRTLVAGFGRPSVLGRVDLATGARLPPFDVAQHATPPSVAYAPDGARLATTSHEVLRLWAPESGEPLAAFVLPAGPRRLVGAAWAPDGSRLAVLDSDCGIHLLDPAASEAEARLELAPLRGEPRCAAPTGVVWAPAGGAAGTLLVTVADRTLRRVDAAAQREAAPLLLDSGQSSPPVLLAGGARALVGVDHEGWLVDVATGAVTRKLRLDPSERILAVAAAREGATVALLLSDALVVADADSGAVRAWLEVPVDVWTPTLDFAPDGRSLVATSRELALRWELGGGHPTRRVLAGERSQAQSAALGPDGRLAYAVDDGTVLLVDPAGGEP
ncbi:MAG: WD40 repeat domain-containing protein [Polyangiaceae bacterium]|nr:WD40 repeat domain-containing protein [Polyangiaceae bacterium]